MPTAGRITETDIVELYPDVFDGRLGLLEGDVHFEVDPNVPPVQMPLRRQPVAVRDRVEAELQKLVAENVIPPLRNRHRGYQHYWSLRGKITVYAFVSIRNF
jgi:hypothetical protein